MPCKLFLNLCFAFIAFMGARSSVCRRLSNQSCSSGSIIACFDWEISVINTVDNYYLYLYFCICVLHSTSIAFMRARTSVCRRLSNQSCSSEPIIGFFDWEISFDMSHGFLIYLFHLFLHSFILSVKAYYTTTIHVVSKCAAFLSLKMKSWKISCFVVLLTTL